MAIRKASSYSRKRARPYTRNSRSKAKSYIKTVPVSKIAKFHGGAQSDFRAGKHPFIVRFIANEHIQVRDNALEAGRMFLTKMMDEKAPGQYYIAVKVFPHHFLRDNKTAAGAGADRMSTGMSHSFGVIVGRAAIVAPGKELFLVSCTTQKGAQAARDAMLAIRPKIPGRTSIRFEKIK